MRSDPNFEPCLALRHGRHLFRAPATSIATVFEHPRAEGFRAVALHPEKILTSKFESFLFQNDYNKKTHFKLLDILNIR